MSGNWYDMALEAGRQEREIITIRKKGEARTTEGGRVNTSDEHMSDEERVEAKAATMTEETRSPMGILEDQLSALMDAFNDQAAELEQAREPCQRVHVDPDSQHLLDIIDNQRATIDRLRAALEALASLVHGEYGEGPLSRTAAIYGEGISSEGIEALVYLENAAALHEGSPER